MVRRPYLNVRIQSTRMLSFSEVLNQWSEEGRMGTKEKARDHEERKPKLLQYGCNQVTGHLVLVPWLGNVT